MVRFPQTTILNLTVRFPPLFVIPSTRRAAAGQRGNPFPSPPQARGCGDGPPRRPAVLRLAGMAGQIVHARPPKTPFQNRISSGLSLPMEPRSARATLPSHDLAAASLMRRWRVPVTRQAPHCDPTGASPWLRRYFPRAYAPFFRAKSCQRRCELAGCDPAATLIPYSSSSANASPGAAFTQRRASA